MDVCWLDYIKEPDVDARLNRFIFNHIRILMWCSHEQCARDAAAEVKQRFLMGCSAGREYKDIQHFWNSLRRFISDGCHRYPGGWPSSCLYPEIPANPREPRASDTTSEAESPQQISYGHELFNMIEADCISMGSDGKATLLFIKGYSYDQIAEKCGCTRGAALARVHRGLGKLAAILARRGIL